MLKLFKCLLPITEFVNGIKTSKYNTIIQESANIFPFFLCVANTQHFVKKKKDGKYLITSKVRP